MARTRRPSTASRTPSPGDSAPGEDSPSASSGASTGNEAELARELEKLRNDNAQLRKENIDIQVQHAKEKAYVGIDGRIVVGQCPNEKKSKIVEAVKMKVWSVFKFMSDNPDDCDKIYALARQGMDPKIKGTKAQKKAWEKQHEALIAWAMNKHRSYTQSELKKILEKNFCKKGKALPLVDLIAKCVYRTIDKDDEEEMEIFKFYVQYMLPCFIGKRKEFGHHMYCYKTLSEATSSSGDKLVTPQDEAMVLAVYENIRDFTPHFFKAKQETEGAADLDTKPRVYNDPPAEGQPEAEVVDGVLRLYGRKFKPKFSNCKAGSIQSAGWIQEGVEYYTNAWVKAQEARTKPECAELEKALLEKLQRDHKVKKAPVEPQDTSSKKRKAVAPALYDMIQILSSDDESGDEG